MSKPQTEINHGLDTRNTEYNAGQQGSSSKMFDEAYAKPGSHIAISKDSFHGISKPTKFSEIDGGTKPEQILPYHDAPASKGVETLPYQLPDATIFDFLGKGEKLPLPKDTPKSNITLPGLHVTTLD